MLRETGTPALEEGLSEEDHINGPQDEWDGSREEGTSWEPRERRVSHEGRGVNGASDED